MEKCEKCEKIFKNLNHHNKKNPNCCNRCFICLKYFKSKKGLSKHEFVICKQKFECSDCLYKYSSRQRLKSHKCNLIKKVLPNDNQINIIPNDLIKNLHGDKNIIINPIYNINNEMNTNSKNELNNNNKNELNNNSKNDNSKNDNSKKVLNNFMNTEPKNFNFDYIIKESLRNEMSKYINMDGYKEEEADQFLYEEDKFKNQDEDIRRKYEKEPLHIEGMKEFFSELQKEPKNRNVVIKKSKSGKCHVYDTSWNEKKLKDITTKICNKVCDTLFDKDSSTNQFIREVIGSQPGRCRLLRKHIQEEIKNAGKLVEEEERGMIE